MLFIFDTAFPQKYLLCIAHESSTALCDIMLDLPSIEEMLREEGIVFPQDGNLQKIEMDTGEDIVLLVWKFDNLTPCSSAHGQNFANILNPVNLWKLNITECRGTISLPFFRKIESRDGIEGDLLFSEASEATREVGLLSSLQSNHFWVFKWSHKGDGYCKFSGGGDLCVKIGSSPSLVVHTHNEEQAQASESEDNVDQENLAKNPSPPAPGTSKLSSLVTLKYQLWANMIVIAVGTFLESVNMMKKKDLIALKQIFAYGIACTGDGTVGMYKLNLFLNNITPTTFTTKVTLGVRDRLTASKIIDCALLQIKEMDCALLQEMTT